LPGTHAKISNTNFFIAWRYQINRDERVFALETRSEVQDDFLRKDGIVVIERIFKIDLRGIFRRLIDRFDEITIFGAADSERFRQLILAEKIEPGWRHILRVHIPDIFTAAP
jgi:hypothetical protein